VSGPPLPTDTTTMTARFVVSALIRDVFQKCHEAEGFDPKAPSDWDIDEQALLDYWWPQVWALAPEKSTGAKAAQINAAPEVGAPTGAVERLDLLALLGDLVRSARRAGVADERCGGSERADKELAENYRAFTFALNRAPSGTPANALIGREHDVLMLRSLIARMPMTEKEPSPELQAWYDEYKDVMERTNPTWWDGVAAHGQPRAALRALTATEAAEAIPFCPNCSCPACYREES